jgi:type IV pilus assembly protein PilC
MPTYNYRAVDQLGRPAHGEIEAVNEVDLEIRLGRIGLDLITFKPVKKTSAFFSRSRISLQDLVMFCFQLEQLTSAGVPLLEGLSDLRDSNTNLQLQKVIAAIISDIESGKLFSQALAEHPQIFSPIFVSLVRAGELSGKLPEVFANLSSTLKWQDDLISQTKRLLAYPLFVLVVVLSTIVFLMIYLVPQMVSFLRNMGQELPLQTRMLIFVSNAFVEYWWLLLSLPVLAIILLALLIKQSPAMRYRWDYLKLKLPVTGEILHKIIMARFSRYFALMYQAGIPILDAIKTCEDIVANKVVADALSRVHQRINAGDNMSESFQNTGLFPSLVVRMIKVGENTGALDKSLLKISDFYDRDVNESIEKMLKLLEPALTFVLGLILAFIMLSVLGPVYDSFTKLKL